MKAKEFERLMKKWVYGMPVKVTGTVGDASYFEKDMKAVITYVLKKGNLYKVGVEVEYFSDHNKRYETNDWYKKDGSTGTAREAGMYAPFYELMFEEDEEVPFEPIEEKPFLPVSKIEFMTPKEVMEKWESSNGCLTVYIQGYLYPEGYAEAGMKAELKKVKKENYDGDTVYEFYLEYEKYQEENKRYEFHDFYCGEGYGPIGEPFSKRESFFFSENDKIPIKIEGECS